MIADSPPPPPMIAPAVDTPSTSANQFVWREIKTDAGMRRYRLFIPAGYDRSRPLPLIVVLHGCTQDADNIARGTRFNTAATERLFIVAYPEQPATANALRCWNWFEPAHQQRDKGEPALIAALTRQVMDELSVNRNRVYIAGVSAGAAMALTMIYSYPDLYAAVGVHSGIAHGLVGSIGEGMKAMRSGASDPAALGSSAARAMGKRARPIAAIVFHGAVDAAVNVINATQVVDQLNAANLIASKGRKNSSAKAKASPVSKLGETDGGYHFSRIIHGAGGSEVEQWTVDRLGHAWSGGSPDGTYTDARGPDATAEMVRFFLEHPKT